MANTVLTVGAHYNDCVFGVPGVLLQAVRTFLQDPIDVSKEYGAEMRHLKYASRRFNVDQEGKRAVAEV